MNEKSPLDEEDVKYRFQSMIRAEHATYAAFQRPRYLQIIQRIEQIVRHSQKKESGDYCILKRFEVCNVNGEKRLMKKGTGKMFVCTDELFEIIQKAHSDSGQKGETKTLAELAKTYANITRDQVKAFLHLCQCHLCVRTKIQAAKTPKYDLDSVTETGIKEPCLLPSDAETCSPLPGCQVFVNGIVDKDLLNEDNVQISDPGPSNGAFIYRIARSSIETNNTKVPVCRKRGRPSGAKNKIAWKPGANINPLTKETRATNNSLKRKRGRPSHSANLNALKQCEVLFNVDDAQLELNVSSAEPSETLPFHLVNGNSSRANGDAVRNPLDDPDEPLHAESIGTCLQQLAECQRQLLYVENRRLAIEEVRLQVDQQVAASLLEIVAHLKQNCHTG